MITVQSYTSEKLAPLVKSFWFLKVSNDLHRPYLEQILPDLHHEIIFQLNSIPARKKAGCDKWSNDPQAFFAGQNTRSYHQLLNPGAIIYGIRFHPHTQSLFYNFPTWENTDNLIPFSDVCPKDVLCDCISYSPEETFKNFEIEFIKKASRVKKHVSFAYVDAVIQNIWRHNGNVKLSSVEKLTGVSGRHLENLFLKYVGLSPKQFCNMVRYNYFISVKKNNPEKSLTSCAYEAGFYDQSHLIRHSHHIAGRAPKYLFNNSDMINSYFLGN